MGPGACTAAAAAAAYETQCAGLRRHLGMPPLCCNTLVERTWTLLFGVGLGVGGLRMAVLRLCGGR